MVRRAALGVLAVGLVVASIATSSAHAQSDAWTNEVARRLFDEGVRLAAAGRWPDALERFRRSERLVPRASTAYNIANALYRLDRPTAAMAKLETSEDLFESADAPLVRRRDELRALVKAQYAEVRLRLRPPDATLLVDGVIALGSGGSRRLRLDPGEVRLRLSREGYSSLEETLVLEPGARIFRALVLEPTHPVPPATPEVAAISAPSPVSPAEPVDDRRFVKRPGFWVLIGTLAAAAIAAGVAIAVTRGDDSPQCGTTGECATSPSGATISF